MDEFYYNNQNGVQNNMLSNEQNDSQNQVTPPQQNYYTPPIYNKSSEPTSFDDPPQGIPPKKKKSKTFIAIVIIIVICGLVAVAGIVGVTYFGIVDDGTSTSQSEEQSENSASANVVSSEEAAKTDKDGNLTAAGVAQKVMDSCVGITVYAKQNDFSFFNNYGSPNTNGDDVAAGEGSGVVMSQADGKTYIMTCAHVIVGGNSFIVTANDGKTYDAVMVGVDSQTDIGVLCIDTTDLEPATFGDSEDIEIGENCVAVGCPGGLEFINSVTQGIVSALARPISSSIGYTNECIQVDAAINPGNSGGALFNMQGQVIGINSSKIASTEYEGMGFAVPSNTAVNTANSLIKDGYVAGRAKLGIQYVELSKYNNASSILSELDSKGFKNAEGTMVIQTINYDSSLNGKDVKQYDMIVAVDGETLTSTDVMTSYLSEHEPGDTCTLTIARISNNSIETFEVECELIESKQ